MLPLLRAASALALVVVTSACQSEAASTPTSQSSNVEISPSASAPTSTIDASPTTTTTAGETTTSSAAPTTTSDPVDTPAAAGLAKKPGGPKRPPVTATPAKPVPAGDHNQVEAAVFAMVNAERAKAGCQPLQADKRLITSARGHSQDMASRNYFSHNTPEGRNPFQRMADAGYPRSAGENIAAGQRTPQAVMNSWMNSAGHRANILNCGYKAIGVGVANGGSFGIYWTQNFGR